jgi:hypothetical protein
MKTFWQLSKVQYNWIDTKYKILDILKKSILIFFRIFWIWPIVQGNFPNSEHQKFLLGGLYHRAKFQINRSTIRTFMRFLRFFMNPGVSFWDESRTEEVRDGPMVSLAKMIHIMSTFTVPNFKTNKEGRPNTLLNFNISPWISLQTEQFLILWILFFVIVVGNLAVLFALCLPKKKRRSRMHYFMKHLAVAGIFYW